MPAAKVSARTPLGPIRCVLEIAVAVWEPGLTKAQSKQLERVQQCAFYIIMGNTFTNYDSFIYLYGTYNETKKLVSQPSS